MTTPETCSHCGSPVAHDWCARCGQRVRRERLTTAGVLREGLAEILDLEEGLLRTVVDLVRAPERVVGGYWAGHTRPWVHPAKFFFLTFAFAQFVAWRSGAFDEFSAGFISARAGSAPPSTEALVAFLAEYFVILAAGGLLLPVAGAALISARTFAEQVVFACFVFGELALVGAVLLATGWAFEAVPAAEIVAVLVPLYLVWSVRRIFGTGLVRTALATVGILVGLFVGTTFIAGVISGATHAALPS